MNGMLRMLLWMRIRNRMLYKRKTQRRTRVVQAKEYIMIEPNEKQNLACQIDTLNSVQQANHQALIKQILSTKHEVKEIPAGYEINFPYNTSLFLDISEWISLEHLCCPFFTFNLQIEEGQLQLSITGNDHVKRLLREQAQLLG